MTTTPASLLPPEDAERLRTLRRYDILHTLHEAVFNEFVALTARIFSLPISLIALVDEDEVHYHANHGLPGLVQQPRAEALCSMVVRDNKAVVVTDLAQDEALGPHGRRRCGRAGQGPAVLRGGPAAHARPVQHRRAVRD